VTAGGDHILQGLIEIGRRVEGTVEGSLPRRSHFYERASALDIDGAVRVEYADDDSAGSKTPSVLKIFADRVEGGCSVLEAVGVRAQDDMDRYSALPNGLGDECVIRGEAPYVERRAEFDTVGSTGPCGEAGVQGFGTEFKDDGSAQRGMDSSVFLDAIGEHVAIRDLWETQLVSCVLGLAYALVYKKKSKK
jgi:hypothetical protein